MSVYVNLSLSFMGMCGVFKKYSDELQASGSFLKLMFSEPALTLSSTLTFDPVSCVQQQSAKHKQQQAPSGAHLP